MSLIHVGKRTTTSAQDFDTARLSDRSLILIDAATAVEHWSIELTVGTNWSSRYDDTDNAMFAIPEDGIVIAAGQSVVVEVAEAMRMPHNLYGLIVPTGRRRRQSARYRKDARRLRRAAGRGTLDTHPHRCQHPSDAHRD